MDEHLDNAMLTRIAWLYYYEDKSQQDIGELLGIPRIKIVRLLKVIREKKIVEISISDRYSSLFDLEKEFGKASGLADVTIVPTGTNPAENVSYAASRRFTSMCRSFRSIGVGASRAVSAALRLVEPMRKKEVTRIVSLSGSAMPNFAVNPGNPMSGGLLLSATLGIDFFNIWVPAIASTPQLAGLLRGDHVVTSILAMANSVDCAMIGLGAIRNSVLIARGFITAAEAEAMAAAGAVGDIFTHFFGIDGRRIPTTLDGRSITADVPMACPVVAVAYGEGKVAPIVGAVRGRLISGLVTDEKTATAALALLRS